MREIPDGVISMLVTPMLEMMSGGRMQTFVAYDKLAEEISWCAEHQAQGVVVNPSIGELATLRREEREECLRVAMEEITVNHPDLYPIASVAAASTDEAIEYAQLALELGYEAGQMNPPWYWGMDDEEVYGHYREVAKVGLPLVVYNNPALSKFDIKPKLMARLVQIPGVIAIKEVKTNRHVDLEPLFRTVRDANPDAKIYTTFRAFTTSLLLGSNGAFANVQTLPFCVKMYELWDYFSNHPLNTSATEIFVPFKKLEAIQTRLNEVFPRGGEDNYRHIGTTKMAATVVTGIGMGRPRKPHELPDPRVEKNLRFALSAFYAWLDDLLDADKFPLNKLIDPRPKR